MSRHHFKTKVAVACIATATGLYAQGTEPRKYMEHGIIQHDDKYVTLIASNPRPLLQAMAAVSEEYGWVVNYEDAPYESSKDLIEMVAPYWRSTHPNGPPSTIPAGGFFKSTFPQGPDPFASSDQEEHEILDKIVSDYNDSRNPGNFAVRKQADGSYAIVGIAIRDDEGKPRPIRPILDTPISIPNDTRGVFATINIIAQTLSAKTGFKVIVNAPVFGGAGRNLDGPDASSGGDSKPARDILSETLKGMGTRYIWEMQFDPPNKTYVLNLVPAHCHRSSIDRDASTRRI
jgi:hypothetical protein